MCKARKLLIILLVSCVACCSLLALPGNNQKRSEVNYPLAPVPETTLTETSSEPANLQATSESDLTAIEEAPEVVEVPKEELEDMKAIVEELVVTIEEAQDSAAVADASADAVDRAYNLGYAKAEDLTKFFAKVNYLVGFESNVPQWGIGAELGIKIGDGLILSAGANYMVGGFTMDTVIEPFDMDNMTFSLGVGWEW